MAQTLAEVTKQADLPIGALPRNIDYQANVTTILANYPVKIDKEMARWRAIDSNNDGIVTAKDFAKQITAAIERHRKDWPGTPFDNVEFTPEMIEKAARDLLTNYYGKPYVDIAQLEKDALNRIPELPKKGKLTNEQYDQALGLRTLPVTSRVESMFDEITIELGNRSKYGAFTMMMNSLPEPQKKHEQPTSGLVAFIKRHIAKKDVSTVAELESVPSRIREWLHGNVYNVGNHYSSDAEERNASAAHEPKGDHLTPNVSRYCTQIATEISNKIPDSTPLEGYPIRIKLPNNGIAENLEPALKTLGSTLNCKTKVESDGVVLETRFPGITLDALLDTENRTIVKKIANSISQEASPYTNVALTAEEQLKLTTGKTGSAVGTQQERAEARENSSNQIG